MATSEWDTMVDRTSGLQPWRRVMHAANGVLLAVALTHLPVPRPWVLAVLVAALAAQAGVDALRLRVQAWNVAFFRTFRHVASPREAAGPASSTWYTLGVLVAVALFPLEAAVSGILIMGLADPAASYVGRRWGRRSFLGASVEGTVVFALVAFVIVLVRHDAATAVAVAAATALAERLSWPLDDNATIPVVGAGVITLMGSVV